MEEGGGVIRYLAKASVQKSQMEEWIGINGEGEKFHHNSFRCRRSANNDLLLLSS